MEEVQITDVVETVSIDTTSFDCSNVGLNIVTLTVTDGSGNQIFVQQRCS